MQPSPGYYDWGWYREPWPPAPPPRKRWGLRALAVVLALLVAGITIPSFVQSGSQPTSSDFAGFGVPSPPSSLPSGITGPQRQAVTDTLVVVSAGCSASSWGVGTGWPINADHVVTAAHVVGGSSAVEVMSQTQQARLATVVFINDIKDVAVLYVPGAHFSPLQLSTNSSSMITVGFPQDGETVVAASYSGPVDTVNNFPATNTQRALDAIQADIAPGFSGGPVVNSSGRVFAMTVERLPDSPGQGAAVPTSDLHYAETAAQSQTPVRKGPCDNT